MMKQEKIKKFLNKENKIAVVGATTDKEKWGFKKYKELKDAGFNVYPVNPGHKKVYGDTCFSDLKSLKDSLKKNPDCAITIVPPKVTEKIADQCKELGINKVWMQPGSESEKAIDYCKDNNIEVVSSQCIVVDALRRL